jgi:hypothetical protein
LSDSAEINTHHTDPKDTDSDDDSFGDLDEVLYGGNPNDAGILPQPLSTYTQTFENTPNLAAWSSAPGSDAPWAVDSTTANGGTASMKSGGITTGQSTNLRFRGYFKAGQLTFWAKVDFPSSYDYLVLWIDGAPYMTLSSDPTFYSHTVPLTLGIHEIEWRYSKTAITPANVGSAWIDDVSFVAF